MSLGMDRRDGKGRTVSLLVAGVTKKLREAGACFCTLCSKKILYATTRKKVLPHHELDPAHRAAVCALQHTTPLPGATTTAYVPASITDRVSDLKIRVCTFIA